MVSIPKPDFHHGLLGIDKTGVPSGTVDRVAKRVLDANPLTGLGYVAVDRSLTPAKRPTPRTVTAKRPTPRTVTAKRPTPRTVTAKRPTPRTVTVKRPTPRTVTVKRPTPRTVTVKRPTPRTVTAKRPTPRTVTAKRPTPRTVTAKGTRKVGRPPAGLRPGERVSDYQRFTLWIPPDVKADLDRVSRLLGRPQWAVVVEALTAFQTALPAAARKALDVMKRR